MLPKRPIASTTIWRVAVLGAVALGPALLVHARSPFLLRDVTNQTGITFQHTDGSGGSRYIVETITAGLALFDYNGDGFINVYFLSGAPRAGTETDVPPRSALYRNEGGGKCTDVTERAGGGEPGLGLEEAAGDYDTDGDLDLYLNHYCPNVL